jgi:hypothetical protein
MCLCWFWIVFALTNFIEADWKAKVWQSAAAFGGQKLPEAETNRPFNLQPWKESSILMSCLVDDPRRPQSSFKRSQLKPSRLVSIACGLKSVLLKRLITFYLDVAEQVLI